LNLTGKKKTEHDIIELFEEYSKELGEWHERWIKFANAVTTKREELGEIIRVVFEKTHLLHDNGKVKSGNTNLEPKDWVLGYQNVIFNENIQSSEELYRILTNEDTIRWGDRYQYMEEWKKNTNFFSEIFTIIPDLVKALDSKYSYAQIDEQRKIITESIKKLTSALREKI